MLIEPFPMPPMGSGFLRRRHFGEHDETSAAVFDAARFGVFEAGGSFLTVADRHQAIGRDALADEKSFSVFRAFCAERKVILG